MAGNLRGGNWWQVVTAPPWPASGSRLATRCLCPSYTHAHHEAICSGTQQTIVPGARTSQAGSYIDLFSSYITQPRACDHSHSKWIKCSRLESLVDCLNGANLSGKKGKGHILLFDCLAPCYPHLEVQCGPFTVLIPGQLPGQPAHPIHKLLQACW